MGRTDRTIYWNTLEAIAADVKTKSADMEKFLGITIN